MKKSIILRPLVMADAEILFCWKNDAVTRQFSGTTGEVLWGGHFGWFQGVLADPKGKILRIAELNGLPIGLIRTAPRETGQVEIHYTVSPNFREQGLGKEMVALFVKENIPDTSKLVLPIKRGNIRSERIAAFLGLVPVLGSEHITEPGEPPIVEWAMSTTESV